MLKPWLGSKLGQYMLCVDMAVLFMVTCRWDTQAMPASKPANKATNLMSSLQTIKSSLQKKGPAPAVIAPGGKTLTDEELCQAGSIA